MKRDMIVYKNFLSYPTDLHMTCFTKARWYIKRKVDQALYEFILFCFIMFIITAVAASYFPTAYGYLHSGENVINFMKTIFADKILKRIDKLMEQLSEDDGVIEKYELIPKFLDLHNPFILKTYFAIICNLIFVTFEV